VAGEPGWCIGQSKSRDRAPAVVERETSVRYCPSVTGSCHERFELTWIDGLVSPTNHAYDAIGLFLIAGDDGPVGAIYA